MKNRSIYSKKLAIFLIFLLNFHSLSSYNVESSLSEAKLIDFIGKVDIIRNGKKISLKKDMNICFGDNIKTYSYSEIAIKFKDGSIIFIREKSDITIKELASENRDNIYIKVSSGRIFARIRPHTIYPVKFETPKASIAAKGTDIEIEVIDGLAWRLIRIGCASGKLEVLYDDNGLLKSTILKREQMIIFTRGEEIIFAAYNIGGIAGQGLLSLGAKIIPYLIIGIVGAGGAYGAYELYQIIKEEKKPASPEKP